MKYVMAAVFFLGGIALAVYVSVFVLLLNGITDVINGAQDNPTNAGKVAWGIIQIFPLTELSATLILWACWGLAAVIGLRERRRPGRGSGFSNHGGIPFRGSGRWPGF